MLLATEPTLTFSILTELQACLDKCVGIFCQAIHKYGYPELHEYGTVLTILALLWLLIRHKPQHLVVMS